MAQTTAPPRGGAPAPAGEVNAGEVNAGEVTADETATGEVATGEVVPGRLAGSGSRLAAPVLRRWQRIPADWRQAIGLFVAAKLLLTVTGLLVLRAYGPVFDQLPYPKQRIETEAARDALTSQRWLSMWFAWDSFLYQRMVETPVGSRWDQFAFPLLYPFLAKPLAALLGGATGLALLIVANVAFLCMLYYAGRLGRELLGAETGRRFTRYLLLLPTAFLFQAALTESLFLCLVLAAFYHAERRQWARAGAFGFLAATSRSTGFLLVVPLALVLLRQGGYRLDRRTVGRYLTTGWPLALVPAGWLSFMAFCRWYGGDWFAYTHAQREGFSAVLQSPLRTVSDTVASGSVVDRDRLWFVAVTAAIIVLGCVRHLRPAYAAYAVLMILVPLSIGGVTYRSILRYLVVVFPVSLVLAQWARRPAVDAFLIAAQALVQGALFVLWLHYWARYII